MQSWLRRQIGGRARHALWSDRPLRRGREFEALLALVRDAKVPLVHAHNRASVKVALRLQALTGCRVVATAHTMNPYREFAWADRHVAVSRAAADRFRGSRLLISVIPCGVDTEQFRPVPGAARMIRRRLHLPLDAPLVLSVSRLGKKSSVRRVMEAAALMLEAQPDVQFALAGDGPWYTWAEALLRRWRLGLRERFHLLGDRTDVPALLTAADVFAVSPSQEALGLAILEAMACRTPVVAPAVGGIPETFVDGESGLLVRQTPESLADGVLRLLENPARARAMGIAGRGRVQEQFSLTAGLDSHEALYRQVLG
jgi:glycosyltransferase involved in cell wall biosynthesis